MCLFGLTLIDFRSLLALSPAPCEPVSPAHSLLLAGPSALSLAPSRSHSLLPIWRGGLVRQQYDFIMRMLELSAG